jgi:hypothetical protein
MNKNVLLGLCAVVAIAATVAGFAFGESTGNKLAGGIMGAALGFGTAYTLNKQLKDV